MVVLYLIRPTTITLFFAQHTEKSFTQKFAEYKYIDFMYYYNMRIWIHLSMDLFIETNFHL